MTDPHTQVLVVGGGIVGLSTALFLRNQGIEVLLVERHADTSLLPKGRNLNARTMEVYRSHGVADKIIAAPKSVFQHFPERARAVTLAGEELFRETRPAPETLSELSPCTPELVDQSTAEPIILAHVKELGADIRFSTELLSYVQDEHGVTAELLDHRTGSRFMAHAEYLVAADGHRSPIRERLGIGRDVTSPPVPVASIVFEADLTEPLRGRRIALCYLDTPEPNTLLTPLDRIDRWLLIVPHHPDRGEGMADFTRDRCLELVRAAVGVSELDARIVPAVPGCTTFAHPWELTAWVADEYRDRRVFLVGDAVHVMPPTGGLGANTGVQDAHNLSWKLAAVLNGTAGAGLLASYQQERRPIAELACEFATGKQSDRAAGRSDGQGKLAAIDVIMGYRYGSDGPLAEHPDRHRGAPGTRAPHVELPDGSSTIDLFRDRFVLLVGADNEQWSKAASTLPINTVRIDGQTGALLVRPDGFVAWRGEDNPEDLAGALDRALYR